MLPVSRAAFPPPPAANDRQGLVRWRLEAWPEPTTSPGRRKASARPALRRVALRGALLALVASLVHWASHGAPRRPPA